MKNSLKKGTTKKQGEFEQRKEVYFDVLGYTITIIITDDLQRSRDQINIEIGHTYNVPKPVGAFHSYNEENPKSWLFFKPGASAGTVAHECSHAIHRMFGWVGAEIEVELFAYHLGYLVDECIAILYPKKT